jgi:hypothetical protein
MMEIEKITKKFVKEVVMKLTPFAGVSSKKDIGSKKELPILDS